MPDFVFRLTQLLLLAVIGLAVFGNAAIQKIRTGCSGFGLPDPRRVAHFLVDVFFWLAVTAWVAIGVLWFLRPGFLPRVLPLADPPSVAVQILGLLAALIGTALMVGGVVSLGMAFRTSVDHAERTRLVTSGIYRFCRNPIALGLLLNGWGTALLTQTLAAAAVAALLHAGNRLRIFFEEDHLRRTLGAHYEAYCARVGRFLPRRGTGPG